MTSDSNHVPVLEMFKLDGKRALITGGARGLGRTMAIALAEAGADVVIAGRSKETGEQTAAEISTATGRPVRSFAADVTKSDEVERLASEIDKACGPIDILVNNAGTNIRGTIENLSEADWDTVIATNLKGPFLCSRVFGPPMAVRGWGRVINMGSILSVIAIAGRAPYASSKAGIAGLTRVLALEWASTGVTCNAICPGPFATEMNRQLLNDPVAYKQFVSNIPLGRWGELEEVAGVVVFLASNASSYVTGTCLFVDGGWTAR